MDENNKKTPAKRRRGGGPRQSGRKNYASEGDVLSEMPVPSGYATAYPPNFPAAFPATPSKSNTASPAPGAHQANPKSTSKKNGKKGRPDSLSATPGHPKTGRRTPPQSASAVEAFAGSRHFHASPAPSTLPMPKFKLRRSESTGIRPTQEQSPPASDCETPSPSQPAVLARPQAADHLSLLFNAHRAEQAQQQQQRQQQERDEHALRSHSANATANHEQGPFSAPSGLQTSQNPHLFNDQPVPFKLPTRPAQQRGFSDTNGHPVPVSRPEVFSMPLHERIRAARAPGSYPQRDAQHGQQFSPRPRPFGQGQPPSQEQLGTPPMLDKSEQVKRLLGIESATPPPGPAPPPMQYHANPTASLSPAQSPNAHHHAVNPTAYVPPAQTGQTGQTSSNDDAKTRAEHFLRGVLGLNSFLPISSGLDGNSSPRPPTDASKLT